MSTSTVTISSRRNNIQTAVASFVGMVMALPVALLIASLVQPASAAPNNMVTTAQAEKEYALYTEAFTKGFMANVAKAGNGTATAASTGVVSCEAPKEDQAHDQQATYAQPGMGAAMMPTHKEVKEIVKHVHNSYNKHTTNNVTNRDSNNTTKSVVNVSHSNGAVVTTGTSNSGNVSSNVGVINHESNNTANVNSHNNTSLNSNNTTTTNLNSNNQTTNNTAISSTTNSNNTSVIKDSFTNEVDVKVKVDDIAVL